jgi:hypothetical protein
LLSTVYVLPDFDILCVLVLTRSQAFLVFCAGQAYLHQRDRSRGAIALS